MFKHNVNFIIIGILSIILNICGSDNVELTIKQGTVSGLEENTIFQEKSYYSFKGIPYAKPPTGELRFKVST